MGQWQKDGHTYVARKDEMKKSYSNSVWNLNERDYMEDLCVNGWITLIEILEVWEWIYWYPVR